MEDDEVILEDEVSETGQYPDEDLRKVSVTIKRPFGRPVMFGLAVFVVGIIFAVLSVLAVLWIFESGSRP